MTFLLTDIEGSTLAWERNATATAVAVGRHYEILGEVIAAHHGHRPVEQGEGDSTLSAFSTATDAVAAALAAQRALTDICSEMARACKPDPAIFLMALDGNRVGMRTVLLSGREFAIGGGSSDDPITHPDYRIDNVVDVLDLLDLLDVRRTP